MSDTTGKVRGAVGRGLCDCLETTVAIELCVLTLGTDDYVQGMLFDVFL